MEADGGWTSEEPRVGRMASGSSMHSVASGQLQTLMPASNIKFAGQLCRLGSPFSHLKYFLQDLGLA